MSYFTMCGEPGSGIPSWEMDVDLVKMKGLVSYNKNIRTFAVEASTLMGNGKSNTNTPLFKPTKDGYAVPCLIHLQGKEKKVAFIIVNTEKRDGEVISFLYEQTDFTRGQGEPFKYKLVVINS